jgi:hypothetical protein
MTHALPLQEALVYPIARYIPPVAKVNDVDAGTVATELREYVVTPPIERALVSFLEVYAESRMAPTDRIGVWISGFFGSGKSHFAKVLSYLLANRRIEGQTAREIFLDRIADRPRRPEIEALLHRIGLLESHIIMFNIKTEQDQNNREGDSISRIMVRRYLASRGLSVDPAVASLELSLIERGLYDDFCAEVERRTERSWAEEREDFLFIRSTVADALQVVAPEAYPTREEALDAIDLVRSSKRLTVSDMVKRLLAYVEQLEAEGDRERPPRMVFIIDEMGQFIGEDGQKLLELQSIAEEFGTQGKGKLWLIVTAQAKLDELIGGVRAVDDDFGKIGARFDTGLTLTSDDVEQVLYDRILQKEPAAVPEIRDFYHRHEGILTALTELPGSSRREWPGMDVAHFTEATPFLPYHPTLIQAIFSNLQSATATGFQVSDEARSMIGMAQGVLSHPPNGFIEGELGRTVSMDMVYDQIAVNLLPQDTREITNLPKQLHDCQALDQRILKALYLLQSVPWIAVTSETLAHACLRDVREERLGALRDEVEASLQRLEAARYVIPKGEHAWEFLTGTKKTFEEEVAGVRVRQMELRREARAQVSEVLRRIGRLNYQNGLRSFNVTVRGDGEEFSAGEGLVLEVYSPLHVARDPDFDAQDLEQIYSFAHPETVYWVSEEDSELAGKLTRAIRLDTILGKWRAKSTKTDEERELIREKETELHTLQGKIQTSLRTALTHGTVIWNGRVDELEGRTTTLNPIFNRVMSRLVPHVYPRFELAAVKPNEKNIEAALTVMPHALSDVASGLNLFDRAGHLNQHSAVIAEVREELERRMQHGGDTSGKALEDHFTDDIYGWHPVIVRLIMAALFRAGLITAQADNVRYTDPSVPAAQVLFTQVRRFRRAVFYYEPDVAVTTEELRRAQDELNVIFGVRAREETANAVADQILDQVETWRARSERMVIELRAANYPLPDALTDAREIRDQLSSHRRNPGKVVKQFLAHLARIRTWHEQAQDLYAFVVVEKRLPAYKRARRLLAQVRQSEDALAANVDEAEEVRNAAADLAAYVEDEHAAAHWQTANALLEVLAQRYREAYAHLHQTRETLYHREREALEADGLPTAKLHRYLCEGLDWDGANFRCAVCETALDALAYHIRLIPVDADQIRSQAREKRAGGEYGEGANVTRLHLVNLLPQRRIESPDDLDAILTALKDAIVQALERADAVELD